MHDNKNRNASRGLLRWLPLSLALFALPAGAEVTVNAHARDGYQLTCKVEGRGQNVLEAVEIKSNVALDELLKWPNEGSFVMWPNGHDKRFFPNALAISIRMLFHFTDSGRAFFTEFNGTRGDFKQFRMSGKVARFKTDAIKLQVNEQPRSSVLVTYGDRVSRDPAYVIFSRADGSRDIEGVMHVVDVNREAGSFSIARLLCPGG